MFHCHIGNIYHIQCKQLLNLTHFSGSFGLVHNSAWTLVDPFMTSNGEDTAHDHGEFEKFRLVVGKNPPGEEENKKNYNLFFSLLS